MLTDVSLEMIVAQIPQRSIGVLGDLFLDRYLDIDAGLTEPSIETGLDVQPAKEDVAAGLHQPLAGHHALTVGFELIASGELLEDRSFGLLGLQEQRVLAVAADQQQLAPIGKVSRPHRAEIERRPLPGIGGSAERARQVGP